MPHRFLHTSFAALLLVSAGAAQSNLLINGGAETGDLSGWTDPINGGFNVNPNITNSGAYSFWPGFTGPSSSPHTNELRQDIDVSALAAAIDGGLVTATFRGYGRSNSASSLTDWGRIRVDYLAAGGALVAGYDSGLIAPVNVFNLVADTRTVPPGVRTVRVRMIGTRAAGSSTDCFFDDLELGLYEWRMTGTSCPGSNGAPQLSLRSPPWLGSTYALEVSNLTGGFAAMVTGLQSLSVPLQPLGVGFGPGCVLQTTGDAVDLLTQVGGLASWSLALPANPVFSGLELRSQAIELSTQSSVTAVALGVLR
ncbi:MAG: hypothetical protein KAI24_24830 [Planctomycetes bacterium]|nr:hypothetical protein [Planctomycetota bacterium]